MIKYSALLLLLACLSGCCTTSNNQEYQRTGQIIERVSYAIKHPNSDNALEVITQAGTDSRYYVMIRGWLVQELQGVQSQFNATKDNADKEKFQTKITFLHQAIRRIDLE